MRLYKLLFTTLLLAYHSTTYAARPMITDDARVVDPKSCQVESWAKANRESTEYWALPGCNVGQNLEISIGGAATKANGESHTTDFIVQAKTLFRQLTSNSYGYGIVVGQAQHPNLRNQSSMVGDTYFYVPASFSFLDDKFILHTNLGALHERAADRNKMTWGVGSETQLKPNLQFIAEVFGDDRDNPFQQVGLRYWLIPNRVQIDTTYGNRLSSKTDEEWFTVGLRLLSSPILP